MKDKIMITLLVLSLFFSGQFLVYADSLTPVPTDSPSPISTTTPTNIPTDTPTPSQEITPAASPTDTPAQTPTSDVLTPITSTPTNTPTPTQSTLSSNTQNTATTSATIDVTSSTGNNQTASSSAVLTTGDASAIAQIFQIVNTNITGNGVATIINQTTPNTGLDLSQVTTNCTPSQTAVIKTAIANNNLANIVNNLNLAVSTGQNTASGNNSSITTGSINAAANVFNQANTNLSGQCWLYNVINIYGNQQGNIILPYELGVVNNQSTGNPVTNLNTSNMQIINTNQAQVINNVVITNNTGNNSAANQQTGSVNLTSNILNQTNTNINASNWLLLQINQFGSWQGGLVNWMGNITQTPQTTYAWINFPTINNTALSNNQTVNNNQANVTNNLSFNLSTGSNQATGNSSLIKTGNINLDLNVFNLLNSNIQGNNWYYATINFFGNYTGNIIFARPDLNLTMTSNPYEVHPGDEITYHINYADQGYLGAQAVKVVDSLPSTVEFITADNNATNDNGEVTWSLGDIPNNANDQLDLTVKVKDISQQTTIINHASITTTTDEPNLANNQASANNEITISQTTNNSADNNQNQIVESTPTPTPTIIVTYQPSFHPLISYSRFAVLGISHVNSNAPTFCQKYSHFCQKLNIIILLFPLIVLFLAVIINRLKQTMR